MKAVIEELQASTLRLEGTAFLTTDFDWKPGEGCKHHIFPGTLPFLVLGWSFFCFGFFFTRVFEIKIVLSTGKNP